LRVVGLVRKKCTLCLIFHTVEQKQLSLLLSTSAMGVQNTDGRALLVDMAQTLGNDVACFKSSQKFFLVVLLLQLCVAVTAGKIHCWNSLRQVPTGK